MYIVIKIAKMTKKVANKMIFTFCYEKDENESKQYMIVDDFR
jgi:hypothetical protein